MIYKDLNDRQSEALYYNDGPLLILAGAGSGKTKVVTNKIAYLIEEKNIFPSEILAITFTNKAAKEMKDRVAKLLNEDIGQMWIGTFHSLCLRILRMSKENSLKTQNFSIYDRNDQVTVIKDCLNELNISKELYKFSSVLAKISELKNDFIKPEDFIRTNESDYYLKNIGYIYELYEKKLQENNAYDFDDLIIKTVELLEKNEHIREAYRRKFNYIFVDEYQDTNKAQYKFIKLLCKENPNLTVVGDNDQSIYKWRGADITNILNFERDFRRAKVILLEQNYRSTSDILKVANSLIKNNPNRRDKNLWTDREGNEKVKYRLFGHSTEEEMGVVTKIEHLHYKGYSYEDMAILYRTNAQSRGFEETLVREGIPYKIVGGLRFYDRKEIKDIVAYLTLILNSGDDVALRRVINEPKRGIGSTTVAKIMEAAEEKGLSMYEIISDEDSLKSLNIRAESKIVNFVEIIESLKEAETKTTLTDFMNQVIDRTGYIEELQRENTVESRTRIDNIKELVSTAYDYEKREPLTKLEDFLSNISLISDTDEVTEEENAVKLMTVHSSKGLEFKIVFLVGMEENLFPSARSIEEDEDVEEERRLCYVAVTRAEDLLYISSAAARTLYGRTTPALESRFIKEMEDEIDRIEDSSQKMQQSRTMVKVRHFTQYSQKKVEKPVDKVQNKEKEDINIGDKVFHKLWKEGMVVSKTPKGEDYEIVIAFDNKGLKRLMLSVAPIKLVK